MKVIKNKKYTNIIKPKAPKKKGTGKWSVNNYGYNPNLKK